MFVGFWLDEILHAYLHLAKEGLCVVLTLAPSHEILKLKETFLKTVYKTKDVQQVAKKVNGKF